MARSSSCSNKTGLRKGVWTPEEDRKLVAYVTRYGFWNWRQLPKFAGLSRCGKSCRLRWMNYLRPNIKRGNYTKEEEDIIIELHESLGNKWSVIAAKLEGRTDNEIKNHWHTNLKKRSKEKSIAHEVNSNMTDESKQETALESTQDSQGSIQPSLSEVSSFTTDNVAVSSSNMATYNDAASMQTALESTQDSPLMSLQSSLGQVSSLISDNLAASSTNMAAYNDGASMQTYEELMSGDFWTEPFVADSANNDFLSKVSSLTTDNFESTQDSPLMSLQSSISQVSSLTSDNLAVNDGASMETYQELMTGDFWTEPFVAENTYNDFLSQVSSLTTDYFAVSSTNMAAYNDGASMETYHEELMGGDFWTETFVANSAYNDFLNPEAFLFPHSPICKNINVYDEYDDLLWI